MAIRCFTTVMLRSGRRTSLASSVTNDRHDVARRVAGSSAAPESTPIMQALALAEPIPMFPQSCEPMSDAVTRWAVCSDAIGRGLPVV